MKYILSIILVIVTINIYSQDRSQWSRSSSSQNFQIPNMVVKGKLIDSESNDGLSYATISVITADSILISGGITGVVCWSTLYPFDVIKTRVQSNMSISYLDAIKQKRFYSGIHFCLIRALISNSILFYSYEICLDLLKDR